MKKTGGTLNPELAKLISEIGHTDLIVVCDAGLPIPFEARRIDLAYREGQAPFFDVLDVILSELCIEAAIVASETSSASPKVFTALSKRMNDLDVEIEQVPHVEFKERSRKARAFVRTGEFTPYSNIILQGGVPY